MTAEICSSTVSTVARINATACCRVIDRMSERGAPWKMLTGPVDMAPSANQSANPSTPARTTSVIDALFSASSSLNQG